MVLLNDEGIPIPSEIKEEQAQAQLQLQAKQVLAAVAVAMKSALELEDGEGGRRADLRRLAEQFGLNRTNLEADPEAPKAALQRFIEDAQTMIEADAGQTSNFQAIHERLAARSIDPSEILDELPRYLEHTQQLDEEPLTWSAAASLGVLIDAGRSGTDWSTH